MLLCILYYYYSILVERKSHFSASSFAHSVKSVAPSISLHPREKKKKKQSIVVYYFYYYKKKKRFVAVLADVCFPKRTSDNNKHEGILIIFLLEWVEKESLLLWLLHIPSIERGFINLQVEEPKQERRYVFQ